MSVLQNKIDFAVILTVKNANPNGDPLNGNRPREDYDGYGEISDVCICLLYTSIPRQLPEQSAVLPQQLTHRRFRPLLKQVNNG